MYQHFHISNDAHQEQNIDTLCASVPSTALQLCPSLHPQAHQISIRFRKALILFGKCHNIFNKNYVDSEEVVELGKHNIITMLEFDLTFNLQPRE